VSHEFVTICTASRGHIVVEIAVDRAAVDGNLGKRLRWLTLDGP
jgi:hypothetical protein